MAKKKKKGVNFWGRGREEGDQEGKKGVNGKNGDADEIKGERGACS